MTIRSLLAMILVVATATIARADLLRSGDSRWAVLASTQNVEEAIGIANLYRGSFEDLRVAESSNGWFAVIGGPYSVEGGLKKATSRLRAEYGMPSDAFLSNGQKLARTIWTPPRSAVLSSWSYEAGGPRTFSAGGLDFTIEDVVAGEMRHPALIVRQDGERVLRMELEAVEVADRLNARIQLVWLDRRADIPQIVFSSFWNGAHCCTVTKFATRLGGNWRTVDGGTLDGSGYRFEDIDGDGAAELLSIDNSFLYTFSAYATSEAPQLVSRLKGNQLVDQRWEPRFAGYFQQQIYGDEFRAKLVPELWNANSFLAAWTALKSVIGHGADAWTTVLAKYSRDTDWPMSICQKATCAPGEETAVDFPQALKDHLLHQGYLGPAAPAASPAPEAGSTVQTATAKTESEADAPHTASSGTGFFVADGYLVTNSHVVKGCADIAVRRANGAATVAQRVADDSINDLALLRVDHDTGAHADLALQIRLGEPVAAFGYPLSGVLSSSGNFTLGNITAMAGLNNDTRFLQISAPVQPGNSGGPLLDAYGRVIGMVTSKLNAVLTLAAIGDIPQNVNFALRASNLYAFLLSYNLSPALGTPGEKLEPADLAERAASFSAFILCN